MDTERKVSQLDSDVHEIYGLLKDLREDVGRLRTSSNEQGGMLMRQKVRLDMIEANLAQLRDDMVEVKTDVADLKGSVGEILELLRAGRG